MQIPERPDYSKNDVRKRSVSFGSAIFCNIHSFPNIKFTSSHLNWFGKTTSDSLHKDTLSLVFSVRKCFFLGPHAIKLL